MFNLQFVSNAKSKLYNLFSIYKESMTGAGDALTPKWFLHVKNECVVGTVDILPHRYCAMFLERGNIVNLISSIR